LKKKIPALIALLCIIVYTAALLSAARRVYTSIGEQHQRAEQELEELQSFIARGGSGFFSETFREEMGKKIRNFKVLQGVIITGSQGDITFERERGSVIQWDNQSPRFIPHFGYAGLKARQVDVPGLRNVNIYSFINTLNYEQLVRILKQTLAAILGALLLSFITMICTSILKAKSPVNRDYANQEEEGLENTGETADSSPDTDDFSEFTGSGDDSGFSVPEDTAGSKGEYDFDDFDNFEDFIPSAVPGENNSAGAADDAENDFAGTDNAEYGSAGDEDTGEFDLSGFDDPLQEPEDGGDDNFELDDFFKEAELELPQAVDETPSPAGPSNPDAPDIPDTPNGLYSPRSGIGWEAYTRDRLASELHRCAASEQDLVVLLLKCGDGVNCDGRLYKKLAGEAVDFFNLRDLSFENGDRGITVIIPNSDLDSGIIKAEEFHSRILKNCFSDFHAKSDFLVGLSSRSGRLIEAERLLMEASKALEKAQFDGGTPIVAFKSDPEKYRDFIRRGSSG
jgi:hypothetical protein